MDKYYNYFYYYYNIVNVLLLFFAPIPNESMDFDKKKETTAGMSSVHSDRVPSTEELALKECFADFLVNHFGEKTRMRKTYEKLGGSRDVAVTEFVLNPMLVNSQKLGEFMHQNGAETGKLWICINNVKPFSYFNESVDQLIFIFHNEIANTVEIAPSQRVQDKLHNAQCLLDLGVIEGKIVMKKSKNSQNYEPGKKSSWFQEFKFKEEKEESIKPIMIGEAGASHLMECLRKESAFDVRIEGPGRNNIFLDSADREELLKIISKQIPFSEWLLQEIGLNEKQKPCFADLFVSYFGAVTEKRGKGQFVVKKSDFPARDTISGLIYKETEESKRKKRKFVTCLKRASPFANHLNDIKNVDNMVHEFYEDQTISEIAVSRDILLKWLGTCFADFLVIEFGAKTEMQKKELRGIHAEFVLNPWMVNVEKLEKFMHENLAETEKLLNCVNNVEPFLHSEEERTRSQMVNKLIFVFSRNVSKQMIVPSDIVQDKLHNAQCLLDLGVIEGKIQMEKPDKEYEPSMESGWFHELKESKNKPISKRGAFHLIKCLRKGNSFDIKMAKGPKFSLDFKERDELLKIIIKQVPFSFWLLEKIDLNKMQMQCFADLFVSHFEALTEIRGKKFVVNRSNFPKSDLISGLINEEDTEASRKKKLPFEECLKKASPFPNHLIGNLKHVDNFVHEFYDNNFAEVALSEKMQQKMHNVQCWLDLGTLEGKIKTQHIKPMKKPNHDAETKRWLDELRGSVVDNKPVVVSPEGAAHLSGCLHKGTPFDVKLEEEKETTLSEKHQRHLQLLNATDNERSELMKLIKQTPFSEEMYNKIYTQLDCLAKFLAIKHGDDGKCLLKKRRAPNGYFIFEINDKDPFRPYIVNFGNSARVYALSAENCRLPEEDTGVYIENESEEFDQLKDCVVKMKTIEGKRAIDVKDLLKMHIPEQLYLHGFPVEFFPTAEPPFGDDNMCAICQEEYGQRDVLIVRLECGHKYHSNCMQNWIREQDRCPLCTKEILKMKNVPDDPKEVSISSPSRNEILMRMINVE